MTALAGTPALTRFVLRRERVRSPIWLAVIVGMTMATVSAIEDYFPTQAERAARAELFQNPATVLFGGPGFGLDDYTLGPVVVSEVLQTLLIAVGVMSVLLVVRHTRAEEEAGRSELIRAGVVGANAPLTAALATCVVVNGTAGAGLAVTLMASGLAAVDSMALGLGVALAGVTFGALAAVTAQVFEHARTASGLAMLALGVLFLLRGVGDSMTVGGNALSWLSPFSWVAQMRPYAGLLWWPVLLYVVVIATLLAVTFRLGSQRDFGAGLIAPRRGHAEAAPRLATPLALHAHQQRWAIVAWSVAAFAFAFAWGTLADQIDDLVRDNPDLAGFLGGATDITAAFFAVMLTYVSMTAAGYTILSVLRLRHEEEAGRTELVLSTEVGRLRWMGTALTVAGVSAAAVELAGGLGLGLAATLTEGSASWVPRMLGAALVQLPASLLLGALTALLIGVAPRLVMLVWAWFVGGLLISMFGLILQFPAAVMNLSPFELLPQLPAEDLAWGPVIATTTVAAAATGIGLAGFRRRDLVVG